MINYCPNCRYPLQQSGGVKHCPNCDGKYYILETQNPVEPKQLVLSERECLLKDIEKDCSEHIAMNGLRFYGIHWELIKQIFFKYKTIYKNPF